MKVAKQNVELMWITPNAEKIIEKSGRTCYKSEEKIDSISAMAFIHMLIRMKHYAMLEHASASFRIICDRGISHEIVRHRIASYAQESTRWCNYSKKKFKNEITVVEPLNLSDAQKSDWLVACSFAEKKYFDLLKRGVAAQTARSVLPTCLKTEIVMTANFREWRHFITLRSSLAAHPQIRIIAELIWGNLMAYAPNVFEDLRKK